MKKTGLIAMIVGAAMSFAVAADAAAASTTSTKKSAAKKPAAAKSSAVKPTAVDRTKLLDPSKLKAKSPEAWVARFDTTKGKVDIEVHRAWAPNGADRFYNLVQNGFYDGVRLYRVIPGFMAQFGFNGDPKIDAAWQASAISDDPVKESNKRGMVSFAMRGPGTRTTQLFINYADQNARLDGMGFAPFGKVISGMDIVDSFYGGYGEGAPSGRGPSQGDIGSQGNAYLTKSFPELDSIKTARVVGK